MKKLRLEEIQVESYVTDTVPAAKGTVQANAATVLCTTTGPSAVATDCGSCATNQWCC